MSTRHPDPVLPSRGHKVAEAAAGRQLRWCKQTQLIEDGLDDQHEHMRRACLLTLPYMLTEPLESD
eukprot:1489142-Amphidinium_carterae.1